MRVRAPDRAGYASLDAEAAASAVSVVYLVVLSVAGMLVVSRRLDRLLLS